MSGIYYSPEKYGLEPIYEYNHNPDYSFDLIVLWKDAAGRILMGTDSGCSCPSPFESVGVKDLEPATPDAIREWFEERQNSYGSPPPPDEMSKALDAMNGHLPKS